MRHDSRHTVETIRGRTANGPRLTARRQGRTGLLALAAASAVFVLSSPASAGSRFRRGDGDADGTVSVSDALGTVGHLFLGAKAPACPDGADVDDNGRLEITDAIATLGFLFLGDDVPPAPGPFQCGDDPTPDALGPCKSEVCPGDGTTIVEFDATKLALPEDRTGEVASSFAAARIREALTQVFDSPGDTVTLRLEGGVNVAIIPGVPLGVSVEHEPTLTLREDGVFELAVSLETAVSIGVELVDGIEASIAQSQSVLVVFTFDDIDATIAAVQGILAGEILAPLAGTAADGLRAFENAARALENAVAELDAARAIEAQRERARAAAVAAVEGIEGELSKARSALSAAQREVDRLADAVAGAVADFVCKVLGRCDEADALRKAYNAAKRERDRLRDRITALERDLLSAQRAKDAADLALNAAIAAVRGLEQAVTNARAAFESAREKVEGWEHILESLDTGRRNLEGHLSVVELAAGPEASVEAFLSPFPGVTLAGAGVGAGVSTGFDVSLRLELARGGSIDRVVLSIGSETELTAKAALGVGVEGSAALGLSATLGFDPTGGRFELVERSAELGLDVRAVVVAGIGVTAQYGAGRELAIELDLAELDDVAPALWDLVSRGDIDNLVFALVGVEATFSAQDRWIAAAVAKAGGSYVGYGAELGGAAAWDDRGPKSEETVSAASLVEKLFTDGAVTDALELLGGALESTRR